MGVPAFMTLGNHGMTLATFDNWPEARAASSSGGRYSFEAYPSINGSTRTKYPRAWYAFDVGAARFYILQAAWPSSNEANGTLYSNDYAFNWDPTSTSFGEEYRWLRDDLAVRPNQQKFAFFHFPLYSDHSDEPSDSYLQIDGPAGADSLEGLLSRAGVAIVFNGHAHIYERNIAQHGIVSYVTGGGGAELEDVSECSPFDAYAIGWATSADAGDACRAPVPTSITQVYHFLKVTVLGTTVTVTPTDELGREFDVQSYDCSSAAGCVLVAPVSDPPPATSADLTALPRSPTAIQLTWPPAADNASGLAYNVYRDGEKIAVTSGTGDTVEELTCGTRYTFAV